MKKSFIDRIQTDKVKPGDRLIFAGACILTTPLIIILTAVAMVGCSGWLIYLAVRQIITKEEM